MVQYDVKLVDKVIDVIENFEEEMIKQSNASYGNEIMKKT